MSRSGQTEEAIAVDEIGFFFYNLWFFGALVPKTREAQFPSRLSLF